MRSTTQYLTLDSPWPQTEGDSPQRYRQMSCWHRSRGLLSGRFDLQGRLSRSDSMTRCKLGQRQVMQ